MRDADNVPIGPAAGSCGTAAYRGEREVLGWVARGETNAEIAHRLGVTIHTIERHLVNIYRKIDVRGRAEAAAYAVREGLA